MTHDLKGTLRKLLEREILLTTNYKRSLAAVTVQKIANIQGRSFICTHCKHASLLSRCSFIQDFWYEGPSGCSGGDTWHPHEKKVCYIICPSCREWNYLHTHSQREELVAYLTECKVKAEQIFAKVYENHPDGKTPSLTQVHPKIEKP